MVVVVVVVVVVAVPTVLRTVDAYGLEKAVRIAADSCSLDVQTATERCSVDVQTTTTVKVLMESRHSNRTTPLLEGLDHPDHDRRTWSGWSRNAQTPGTKRH